MEIKIIDAEEKYYPQMLKICEECFGSGYLTYSYFCELLKMEAPFKMAVIGQELIGYSVFETSDADDVSVRYQLDRQSVVKIAGDRKIFCYKSAAVRKNYTRNGIAGKLLRESIEQAKGYGCGSVFVAGWKYNGRVPMHHVFIQNGFVEIGLRKNLWYNEKEYTCIICKGRCICDGVIYYLKLD